MGACALGAHSERTRCALEHRQPQRGRFLTQACGQWIRTASEHTAELEEQGCLQAEYVRGGNTRVDVKVFGGVSHFFSEMVSRVEELVRFGHAPRGDSGVAVALSRRQGSGLPNSVAG